MLTDAPFDDATDVGSIAIRLHPLDVGFDLRVQRMPVDLSAHQAPELRVSYAARAGERRVMSGPRAEVLSRLRRLGYVVRS